MRRLIGVVVVACAIVAPVGARADADACRTLTDPSGDVTDPISWYAPAADDARGIGPDHGRAVDIEKLTAELVGEQIVFTLFIDDLDAPRYPETTAETYSIQWDVEYEHVELRLFKDDQGWRTAEFSTQFDFEVDLSADSIRFFVPVASAVGSESVVLSNVLAGANHILRIASDPTSPGWIGDSAPDGGAFGWRVDLNGPCEPPTVGQPSPQCLVLSDPEGDARNVVRLHEATAQMFAREGDASDIIEVWLGSTATDLVVDLRVEDLTAPYVAGADARMYSVRWGVGAIEYRFDLFETARGNRATMMQYSPPGSSAYPMTATIDRDSHVVRFTTPLSEVPSVTAGDPVFVVEAWTTEGRSMGFGYMVPGAYTVEDRAESNPPAVRRLSEDCA